MTDKFTDALIAEVVRLADMPVYHVTIGVSGPRITIVSSMADGIKLEQTWTVRLTKEGQVFTKDEEQKTVS